MGKTLDQLSYSIAEPTHLKLDARVCCRPVDFCHSCLFMFQPARVRRQPKLDRSEPFQRDTSERMAA